MESHLRVNQVKEERREEAESEEKCEKLVSVKQAELKRLENQQLAWVRKRHRIDDVLPQVHECLQAIHSLLDPNKTGLISAKELVSQLISLGLSTDPNVITKVLFTVYKQKSLTGFNLTLEQILELSKVDRVTDKILTLLCTMANASQAISHSIGGTFRPIHPAKTDISWRDCKMSLTDYNHQLRKLWYEICVPEKGNGCEFEHMATCLVQLGVFVDRLEVQRTVQELRGGEDPSNALVTFLDFQSIFARSVFKGALVTLAQKLGNGIGGLMTPKLVISLYQRRLLLSGLQAASDVSHQDGITTLKAVEEYAKRYKDN